MDITNPAYVIERMLAQYFSDPSALSPDEARALGIIQARLQRDADRIEEERVSACREGLLSREDIADLADDPRR
jgi:hypothetical protein